LEDVIIKVSPVIAEITKIVTEFSEFEHSKNSERQRYFKGKEKQKKKLKLSFNEEQELDLLKKTNKFKLNVRNILGIKHQDDWIFNLNIGNVMHLSPMNADELSAKLEKSHELNKDSMLEKIILFVVSYFCVGTELRFLSQKEAETGVSKKDSEMWQAKSLHVAATFLPEDCPLVTHIINNYKKNHMNPKLEQRKKELAENPGNNSTKTSQAD